MERTELKFRHFEVLSGVRHEKADLASCFYPRGGTERKGALALFFERVVGSPSFEEEACRVIQEAVTQSYFSDASPSLTTSLTNALDSANSALLSYNYSGEKRGEQRGPAHASQESGTRVAVHGSGIRQRGVEVGLTAVLVRPDGSGVYLAQMAPTQAYVSHNDLLSALPEPPGWLGDEKAQPHSILEESVAYFRPYGSDHEESHFSAPLAPPLGSSSSAEADMVFRRVDPGDLIVLTSTSLARHLDRATLQNLISSHDPDLIIEELAAVSIEHGLARAYGAVLQIGADTTTGIQTTLDAPLPMLNAQEVSSNGGAHAIPPGPSPSMRLSFPGSLRTPREWFQRRTATAKSEEALNACTPGLEPLEASAFEEPGESDEGSAAQSSHLLAAPTEALLQRTLDVPPFRASQISAAVEKPEELEFDGWEDTPPAIERGLGMPPDADFAVFKPSSVVAAEQADDHEQLHSLSRSHSRNLVPALFPDDDEADLFSYDSQEQDSDLSTPRQENALLVRLKGLRDKGGLKTETGEANTSFPKIIPIRAVIAFAAVLVTVLLLYSITSLVGQQQVGATRVLLEEAKQEELLANQPGSDDATRLTHYTLALEKAQEAQTADPKSVEAQLLVAELQLQIDKIEGVGRLVQPRLLVDLTTVGSTQESVASSEETTDSPAGTGAVSALAVQSNDLYALSGSQKSIYKCSISAQNCQTVLQSGDSAGGQTVGELIALTLRVGNLIAIDDKLTSYIYSSESSSWQAQPLGNASTLQKPVDISTYDGNLYLLGAKAGQISKFISGRYGEPPEDWVKDPDTVAALKDPVAMAIDGAIYVLQRDGKILTLLGGKVTKTLDPATTKSAASHSKLYTSTDTRNLYILRSDGVLIQSGKEGGKIAAWKAPADMPELLQPDSIAVDEGRGKIFMAAGLKVYEAALPGQSVKATGDGKQEEPAQSGTQARPNARPTAEP